MGLTFVVSKLPTSPKGSAFELFYVTVFLAFQKFIDISFQGIFIGAGGKLFSISLRKEIRIPTHFILLYSPAFFCVLHTCPVWSIWQLFLSAFNNWPCQATPGGTLCYFGLRVWKGEVQVEWRAPWPSSSGISFGLYFSKQNNRCTMKHSSSLGGFFVDFWSTSLALAHKRAEDNKEFIYLLLLTR